MISAILRIFFSNSLTHQQVVAPACLGHNHRWWRRPARCELNFTFEEPTNPNLPNRVMNENWLSHHGDQDNRFLLSWSPCTSPLICRCFIPRQKEESSTCIEDWSQREALDRLDPALTSCLRLHFHLGPLVRLRLPGASNAIPVSFEQQPVVSTSENLSVFGATRLFFFELWLNYWPHWDTSGYVNAASHKV